VWARVHKVDRIRPQADGSAHVLVEDERNAATMSRNPGLSTLVAVARVLNGKRVLDAKYGGKGEVRYACGPMPPSFLFDAIVRAGGVVTDAAGETVVVPASPGAVSGIVDHAFAELAHGLRSSIGAHDMATALKKVETQRRKAPVDRDTNPALYWTAVFELAALAGELSRQRGGRWIDTKEMPVPFAIRFSSGELAAPAKTAMQIVEGAADPLSSLADETGEKPGEPT
jgi:hypothetical protein